MNDFPRHVLSSLASAIFFFAAATVSAVELDREKLESFLEANCYECHDDLVAEAGFDLFAIGDDLNNPADFINWSHVFERVEKGEMPPEEKERPDPGEMKAFLAHLEGGLVAVERSLQDEFGRAELRRLSREEYANSLKDILDLPHLDLAEMLPPDGLEGHHQKSAGALDFSHVMVSKYMEVADFALHQALAPRVKPASKKVVRKKVNGADKLKDIVQTLFVQVKQGTAVPLNGREIDTTVTNIRGNFNERDPGTFIDNPPLADGVVTFMNNEFNHNIQMRFEVPQTGTYKMRVNGWATLNDHGELKPSDRVETVAFYDKLGNVLGRVDLQPNEPNTGETTLFLKEGEPIEYLAISTPNRVIQIAKHHGEKWKHFKSHGIALRWFELEGPLEEEWPPESHRRVLGDLKLEPTEQQPNGVSYRVVTADPEGDARRLLKQFATRAYRRPFEAGDIDLAFESARARLEAGESFVDSILAGYRTILTSPDFLLRTETKGRLDSWALATRLSFFLTNSPPDGALRRAAADGSILDNAVLRKHTNRLLSSPKSKRFHTHFLDYWVNLRNIALTEPDENIYPEYSGLVTESMLDETREFFAEMIREDLGSLAVVDSDFLIVNQRLAELYQIPGVQGSQFQKVSLPEGSPYGGLLTQGSILKLTANGTTTSPVVRGTFALEHLLGDPPPPPPGAVPAIEPDISGATTMREQLQKHREAKECASCHAKIDPPGFALENFDVMGQWREQYRVSIDRGERGVDRYANGKRAQYKLAAIIEPEGELPNGATFDDIHSFREALQSYDRKIAHNLLEHLTIYGTGAKLSFADRPEAEAILDSIEPGGYGTRSMIHALVQSDLFRYK